MTPEDYSKASYSLKVDPAWIERVLPLTASERLAVSAEDLKNLTQEELDQLYFRIKAGPIRPDKYQGTVLIKDGVLQNGTGLISQNSRAIQMLNWMCKSRNSTEMITCLAEYAWKGKQIYPIDETGVYPLRNAIDFKLASALTVAMTPTSSLFKPLQMLLNKREDFFGESKVMLFPAKVYCGLSLIDSRRESIVIDYSYGDYFKPFIKGIDDLVGRGQLNIRDEVRMLRPGFYLGRAYANKIFLLNFALTSPTQLKEVNRSNQQYPEGQCFNGTTTR